MVDNKPEQDGLSKSYSAPYPSKMAEIMQQVANRDKVRITITGSEGDEYTMDNSRGVQKNGCPFSYNGIVGPGQVLVQLEYRESQDLSELLHAVKVASKKTPHK